MNETPLISVIIPTYNRESIVGETLESVFHQTYPHWECIVVDDGSDDGSQLVVETFCKRDSRFRWIPRHRDPKGANTCRNIGAELASGTFLLFLDSDDLLAPWALEERLRQARIQPSFDLLVNQGMEFDNTDTGNRRARTCFGINDPLHEFLSYEIPWGTPNVLWKKEFFEKTGGWHEFALSWQDVLMHTEALAQNATVCWASEIPDTFVRVESGFEKISNRWSLKKIRNRAEILDYLEKTWAGHPDFKAYRQQCLADIINRMEFLPAEEIQGAVRENFSFLGNGNSWGIRTYFRLLEKTRNFPFIHGLVYRLRPLFIAFSRKNPISKHPVISEPIFIQLLDKGSRYPFLAQKIRLFAQHR